MIKKTQRLCRVEFLKPGERFEVPSLKETMRNLKLVSSSDCSSLVEGQRRDSTSEEWKPFRYHITNSLIVQPVSTEMPPPVIEKDSIINNNMEQQTEKRGRGRPRKEKTPFMSLKGIDNEFTTSDLVQLNNIKPHEAHQAISAALQDGKIVQTRENKGKRGKPQKVYRLI
jgi:hypothetical protein